MDKKVVKKTLVEPQQQESSVVLRESRALLALRLMSLVLLFVCAFALILILTAATSSILHLSDIVLVNVFFFFFMGLVSGITAMFVILKWQSESYTVTQEGIIRRSGILRKKEEHFTCSFVEGMTVEQSMIGRFFDYGNIVVYDPSQKTKIHLLNVPNPTKNGDVISKIVKKSDDKSIPVMPIAAEGELQAS